MDFERARFNMVEQQVRPWEVLDSRVLEALTAMRREDFVPAGYHNLAFADLPLPLAHGETMMKPVVEGRVLQAVAPTRAETVLEIGTGSGFLTACLARLAASVHSIELHADLAAGASVHLRDARVGNASVEVAEAVHGFKPAEQYDAVVHYDLSWNPTRQSASTTARSSVRVSPGCPVRNPLATLRTAGTDTPRWARRLFR